MQFVSCDVLIYFVVLFNSGDLEGALNQMTQFASQYRCTPYKQQLITLLIEKEDSDALQRLLDVSIRIHGEANSIIDLALGFLECDRLREAKKVLEVYTW